VGRIRTIKPEFFKDEDLAELPFEARLCFAGLWTQADREGRLEDRPRRLKIELFPYDDVDLSELLNKLSEAGFIERYEADKKRCIQIVNFRKHQRISGKESELHSEIPPPPQNIRGSNGEAPEKQPGIAVIFPVVQEGKGREGKGRERKGAREEFPAVGCSEQFVSRVREAWKFTKDWSYAIESSLVDAFFFEEREQHSTMEQAAEYVTARLERIAELIRQRPASEWGFYPLANVINHPKHGRMYRRPDEMWEIRKGTAKQQITEEARRAAFQD